LALNFERYNFTDILYTLNNNITHYLNFETWITKNRTTEAYLKWLDTLSYAPFLTELLKILRSYLL